MEKKVKQGNSSSWPKLAFFLFSLFLVTTQTTDADLLDIEVIPNNSFAATTLDFSNRNTANNSSLSSLFSVVGMIPGGFQVESLRVKQDGELDFNYQITTELPQGSDGFCEELNAMVLRDFTQVYSGSLQGFSLGSSIVDGQSDDLVLFISFANHDISFVNKTCNFNFKFITILEESGFVDEEIIQNQISSGIWTALE